MKKTTGMDRAATRKWRPATRAVRAGTWRSEHGETSEAMYLTSGYTYDDAQTVADRFAGEAVLGKLHGRAIKNPLDGVAGNLVFALPHDRRHRLSVRRRRYVGVCVGGWTLRVRRHGALGVGRCRIRGLGGSVQVGRTSEDQTKGQGEQGRFRLVRLTHQ